PKTAAATKPTKAATTETIPAAESATAEAITAAKSSTTTAALEVLETLARKIATRSVLSLAIQVLRPTSAAGSIIAATGTLRAAFSRAIGAARFTRSIGATVFR